MRLAAIVLMLAAIHSGTSFEWSKFQSRFYYISLRAVETGVFSPSELGQLKQDMEKACKDGELMEFKGYEQFANVMAIPTRFYYLPGSTDKGRTYFLLPQVDCDQGQGQWGGVDRWIQQVGGMPQTRRPLILFPPQRQETSAPVYPQGWVGFKPRFHEIIPDANIKNRYLTPSERKALQDLKEDMIAACALRELVEIGPGPVMMDIVGNVVPTKEYSMPMAASHEKTLLPAVDCEGSLQMEKERNAKEEEVERKRKMEEDVKVNILQRDMSAMPFRRLGSIVPVYSSGYTNFKDRFDELSQKATKNGYLTQADQNKLKDLNDDMASACKKGEIKEVAPAKGVRDYLGRVIVPTKEYILPLSGNSNRIVLPAVDCDGVSYNTELEKKARWEEEERKRDKVADTIKVKLLQDDMDANKFRIPGSIVPVHSSEYSDFKDRFDELSQKAIKKGYLTPGDQSALKDLNDDMAVACKKGEIQEAGPAKGVTNVFGRVIVPTKEYVLPLSGDSKKIVLPEVDCHGGSNQFERQGTPGFKPRFQDISQIIHNNNGRLTSENKKDLDNLKGDIIFALKGGELTETGPGHGIRDPYGNIIVPTNEYVLPLSGHLEKVELPSVEWKDNPYQTNLERRIKHEEDEKKRQREGDMVRATHVDKPRDFLKLPRRETFSPIYSTGPPGYESRFNGIKQRFRNSNGYLNPADQKDLKDLKDDIILACKSGELEEVGPAEGVRDYMGGVVVPTKEYVMPLKRNAGTVVLPAVDWNGSNDDPEMQRREREEEDDRNRKLEEVRIRAMELQRDISARKGLQRTDSGIPTSPNGWAGFKKRFQDISQNLIKNNGYFTMADQNALKELKDDMSLATRAGELREVGPAEGLKDPMGHVLVPTKEYILPFSENPERIVLPAVGFGSSPSLRRSDSNAWRDESFRNKQIEDDFMNRRPITGITTGTKVQGTSTPHQPGWKGFDARFKEISHNILEGLYSTHVAKEIIQDLENDMIIACNNGELVEVGPGSGVTDRWGNVIIRTKEYALPLTVDSEKVILPAINCNGNYNPAELQTKAKQEEDDRNRKIMDDYRREQEEWEARKMQAEILGQQEEDARNRQIMDDLRREKELQDELQARKIHAELARQQEEDRNRKIVDDYRREKELQDELQARKMQVELARQQEEAKRKKAEEELLRSKQLEDEKNQKQKEADMKSNRFPKIPKRHFNVNRAASDYIKKTHERFRQEYLRDQQEEEKKI